MSTRSEATAEAVGKAPRRAFEHDPADKVALRDDGIEHALDRRDRRCAPHHARVHPLLESFFGQPRDAEQLDAIASSSAKSMSRREMWRMPSV